MEREEVNETVVSEREKGSLLAKAGQLTLQHSQYSSNNKNQGRKLGGILQEIDNDDEFIKLDNITTTYLPVNNSNTNNNVSIGSKEEAKATHNQSEYQNITHKIKQNSQMVLSSLLKKNERVKASQRPSDDLNGIEDIIGDIQRVMEASLANSKVKSPFKKETAINHHSAKRNFHSKGMSNFKNSQGINRLQQLLLHYQMDDPQLHSQPITINLKDPISQRRAKNEQRLTRTKQYNSISKSINQPISQSVSQQIIQPFAESNIKQTKKPSKSPKQIGLSNIQIVQIDWFKLPLFLSPLTQASQSLLLKMKDYPDDESFWTAIAQSLREEHDYKAYSIFNRQFQAGINKESLMSEQQFRERWAEEWSYEIDEEEHKDLLSQFDFQWYRSLVQVTYSHSLQDILMKDIKYKIELFRQNLKLLSHPPNNDKNASTALCELSNLNKLKYIDSLLDDFAKNKRNRTNSNELFIGVVPNIGQSQSKQAFESLKTSLREIFVGGLYSSDSLGTSMGVIITKKQAKECGLQKWEGGKVKLGEVELLINQEGGGSCDQIVLSRGKSKNSSIRLKVLRPGEQALDLQVGQQLYLGLRYHILLD